MGHSPNTTGDRRISEGKGICTGYGQRISHHQVSHSEFLMLFELRPPLAHFPRSKKWHIFLSRKGNESELKRTRKKKHVKIQPCNNTNGTPKTNHLEPWEWLINQHPIKPTLLKFTSTWNPQGQQPFGKMVRPFQFSLRMGDGSKTPKIDPFPTGCLRGFK